MGGQTQNPVVAPANNSGFYSGASASPNVPGSVNAALSVAPGSSPSLGAPSQPSAPPQSASQQALQAAAKGLFASMSHPAPTGNLMGGAPVQQVAMNQNFSTPAPSSGGNYPKTSLMKRG